MNSKRNKRTVARNFAYQSECFLRSWAGDVKRPSVTQYRRGLCHWKCLATRNTITRPNFGFTLAYYRGSTFRIPHGARTQATPLSLSLSLSFTFSYSDSRPRNTFCDLNFVSRDKLPDKSDFRPATKRHPRSKAWLCLDAWLPNSSSFFSSLFRFVPSSRLAIPWNPIGRLSKTVCASRGLSIHVFISLHSTFDDDSRWINNILHSLVKIALN